MDNECDPLPTISEKTRRVRDRTFFTHRLDTKRYSVNARVNADSVTAKEEGCLVFVTIIA